MLHFMIWKMNTKIFHITQRFTGCCNCRCWEGFVVWALKSLHSQKWMSKMWLVKWVKCVRDLAISSYHKALLWVGNFWVKCKAVMSTYDSIKTEDKSSAQENANKGVIWWILKLANPEVNEMHVMFDYTIYWSLAEVNWILSFKLCEVNFLVFLVPLDVYVKRAAENPQMELTEVQINSVMKYLVEMHRGDSRIQDIRLSSVKK